MNKRQKEILQNTLTAEERELKHLKAIYNKALSDINDHIARLKGREDADLQHVIYQIDYQIALKGQISAILDELNSKQFESITQYMAECYEDGFVGAMYDIAGQGIPIITPIDQKQVLKAMKTDSNISGSLYTKLGEDVTVLKKRVANNLSRGFATGQSYAEMARNIAADSNVGFNKAARIARTEGARVYNTAAYDAQYKAKEKGADIVKQWDASLDGNTRDSHRVVDGEIRELDEKFSNGLMYPSDPAGAASEVINCRCTLLQRATWALDEDELETLKVRAAVHGLDKTEQFEDFKEKYLKASAKVFNAPEIKSDIILTAQESFSEKLAKSTGNEQHVMKMQMHSEFVDYEENENLPVAFLYDANKDIMEYNPKAPNYELYDLNFAQAHELSHRMDILEYDSMASAEFKKAIKTCKARVLENADEIQTWFEEGGKYQSSFALSDIISALSANEIKVPVGHSNEYWEKEENVVREIFANVSAMDVLDTKEKDELNSLLLELYAAYGAVIE